MRLWRKQHRHTGTGVSAFILGLCLISAAAVSCNFSNRDTTGASKGVMKSTDGGETFKESNTIDEQKDISNVSINALLFDPKNPDIIYLGSSGGLYRSEDAAKTWKSVSPGNIYDVAVDNENSKVIYLAVTGKIMRTADGGKTWKDVYVEPTRVSTVLSIAVSKPNSDVVVAGLLTGEVIRSTDQGMTWQIVKDVQDRMIKIVFVNNTFYALFSKKGILKSADRGATWQSIAAATATSNFMAPQPPSPSRNSTSTSNNGPMAASIGQFYDIAIDEKQPATIYLATSQGLIKTTDGGSNFTVLNIPVTSATLPVTAATLKPSEPNVIFAAIRSTILKSENGGSTWQTKLLNNQQSISEILINPHATETMYLGLGVQK
jgi:photosystem II stability/assembly factor-like uncharacterized protein